MSERNFNASDTQLPFPVDLPRVETALNQLGYQYLAAEDRFGLPWPNHRVSIYFAQEAGLHLSMISRMRMSLEMFEINDVARAITLWNAERIGPTALLNIADSGDLEIRFRSAISVDEGLSTDQLSQFLKLCMDTTLMAVDSFLEDFPDLVLEGLGTDELRTEQDEADLKEPIPHLQIPESLESPDEDDELMEILDLLDEADDSDDTDDSESVDMDSLSYPYEVTLDRIRDTLAEIGVLKTQGDEDFLVAWVNEVFLGFFVDNGPTLLVKAHWDPNLDAERDFMKMFMICNQWNEKSLTTKAFCHADKHGLQVRVEFAVPIAEGLNEDQLQHNVAMSIHHLLQAIDTLSKEATGTSIVDWPEKS